MSVIEIPDEVAKHNPRLLWLKLQSGGLPLPLTVDHVERCFDWSAYWNSPARSRHEVKVYRDMLTEVYDNMKSEFRTADESNLSVEPAAAPALRPIVVPLAMLAPYNWPPVDGTQPLGSTNTPGLRRLQVEHGGLPLPLSEEHFVLGMEAVNQLQARASSLEGGYVAQIAVTTFGKDLVDAASPPGASRTFFSQTTHAETMSDTTGPAVKGVGSERDRRERERIASVQDRLHRERVERMRQREEQQQGRSGAGATPTQGSHAGPGTALFTPNATGKEDDEITLVNV